jgi:23S rRNA (cytosine1962-C5)-methyltransferase
MTRRSAACSDCAIPDVTMPMSMPMPRLRLAKDVAVSLRRGHPWIYAAALERPGAFPPGATVEVVDRQGGFVGRGFYDPAGPIAVRLLERRADHALDEAWLRQRIATAIQVRAAARAAGGLPGDAFRLLNGEGDGLPGLVIDVYAGTWAVRCDGHAAQAAWQPQLPVIIDQARLGGVATERVWLRPAEGRGTGGGQAVLGAAPTGPVVVREGPMRLHADVVHGQKTGLFLDQRPGRALVGQLAAARSVLNLFSYTGGFSVAAAKGGARHVTTVDLARPAIAAARENLLLSGIDPELHELVAADCRAFLAEAHARGRRWDLVVCDPPSYAPSERAKPAAMSAYARLNADAAAVVADGGILITASCSSHLGEQDFMSAVAHGLTIAGRQAAMFHVGGAGPDHPTQPAFPEGRYLKLLGLVLQ